MAEHESTEVVSPPTAPILDRPVVDLHGGNEPVTWAGGSLELVERTEHRPTSALDRNPTNRKWMAWAVGGSVGFALILAFALTWGDAEAGESGEDPQAAVEIPSAPPEPEPAPEPVPEPEPKKKSKKSPRKAAATNSTLAGSTEKAAESEPAASKPAAGASKPAAGASKPAAGANKPASSKPAPAPTPAPTPSKPASPNLVPPEDEGAGSKAELPDVSGWDDADAAVADRTADGI